MFFFQYYCVSQNFLGTPCIFQEILIFYFPLQLHENEEKKEGENDNVVYADLDKSALGTGET